MLLGAKPLLQAGKREVPRLTVSLWGRILRRIRCQGRQEPGLPPPDSESLRPVARQRYPHCKWVGDPPPRAQKPPSKSTVFWTSAEVDLMFVSLPQPPRGSPTIRRTKVVKGEKGWGVGIVPRSGKAPHPRCSIQDESGAKASLIRWRLEADLLYGRMTSPTIDESRVRSLVDRGDVHRRRPARPQEHGKIRDGGGSRERSGCVSASEGRVLCARPSLSVSATARKPRYSSHPRTV